MTKRKKARNKAKESGKKMIEGGKDIGKGTVDVTGGTAGALGYTLLSAGEKGMAIASKHKKAQKYSEKSKEHIDKAGKLGKKAIKGTGKTIFGGWKLIKHTAKGTHHLVDTGDKIIGERLEKLGWENRKFVRDNIVKTLILLLMMGGAVTGTVDGIKAKERKEKDKELYGEIKVSEKDAIIVSPEGTDSISVPLDTILENNSDIVKIDATKLGSIMLGEESLKTNKKYLGCIDVKKGDSWLESGGIDRSPYSKSLIGKLAAYMKKGSYGPYQVQSDAIDKYKDDSDDPELYDNLCQKIAKFRFPDINGNYIPLHELLGLTLDDMGGQIKNHTIYTFAGGERFLVAYGIVLIDQISREVEDMISLYDGKKGYDRWKNNTGFLDSERENTGGSLKYPDLTSKNNDLMSPYILLNNGKISYNEIGGLFNRDNFRTGMVSAYRCMDYIKNIKNSDFLNTLNLLELNEWFESGGKGDLDIVTPTGSFGPSTTKLLNKYFNQNFDTSTEGDGLKQAENFMNSIPADTLQSRREKGLNAFEKNMRLLYTLNPEDKNGINQKQSKYLMECLDLTFNHTYAAVNAFFKFIYENCGNNSTEIYNKSCEYRYEFVKHQDKNSLEELKKIMTDEESFISCTKLNKKLYLEWIKYYLCPTLLGASDWVYQTKGIIPVIQKYPGGTDTSNEQNSISRFVIGVLKEQVAQADRERGIECTLEKSKIHDIDSLKKTISNTNPVCKYLPEWRTIYGNTINSRRDIPDELVYEMLRNKNGSYLFEDGKLVTESDDDEYDVYIKYIGLKNTYHIVKINQPATKEVKEPKYVTKTIRGKGKKKPITKIVEQMVTEKKNLCIVNSDGTLTMEKGGSFRKILYIYSQNNSQVKKILENIAGKPITQEDDIDQNVIKKVIKHPDGKDRENVDRVSYGDQFIIVVPLNY